MFDRYDYECDVFKIKPHVHVCISDFYVNYNFTQILTRDKKQYTYKIDAF